MFEIVRSHPNVYVSASCLQFMWEDEHEYPFRSYLERIRALRDGCGADRIMYGTDWPWLEGLGATVTVVVLAACATVTVWAAEALTAKLLSP